MKPEDKEYVSGKINNEGFHYCFVSFSDFKEIEDEKFHELRLNYLDAIIKIKNYLQQ